MSSLLKLTLVQRVQALGVFCLALTAGLVANVVSDSWQERQTAQHEAAGLAPAAAWVKLAKLTAEHRGMSAGFLGGNEDFRAKREAKQKDVDAALKDAQRAMAVLDSPRAKDLLAGQDQEWQALSSGVAAKTVSGKDSFKRHNALVQRQLDVLNEVVAVSGLSVEPEAATYNLVIATLQRLPQASEAAGQLRGFGAGMLAKQSFEPQDKAFMALTLANAQQAFDAVQTGLQRSGLADPAVGRLMAPLQAKAKAAWDAGAGTIQKDILQAELPALAGAAYFAKLTEAIDAQQALATAAFGLLDSDLTARARNTTWKVGIAVGLGLFQPVPDRQHGALHPQQLTGRDGHRRRPGARGLQRAPPCAQP